MKKEQIIKSMLFLIIPLFAISCDGNGFMEYEETALMQRDAQQGLLSDGASDNICMVNLNLFTKPYLIISIIQVNMWMNALYILIIRRI